MLQKAGWAVSPGHFSACSPRLIDRQGFDTLSLAVLEKALPVCVAGCSRFPNSASKP